MNTTNEFSFLLKPANYWIWVFAAHFIEKWTYLRLFSDNNLTRKLKFEEVPEKFKMYCAYRSNYLICPTDFWNMPIWWYLNHSDNPNAIHDKNEKENNNYWLFLAWKDILEWEEITINYNDLEEPDEFKEDYYKK